MHRPGPRRAPVAALILIGSLAVGCATYRTGLEPVLERLTKGDPSRALEALERSPRETDALYLLERATLLRAVGRLDESSRTFDDADRIAEDLYTRSLSNEAASLVTSDRVRPYRPASYERLLARFFQARNYADIGDREGALVEARRIERLLDELQDAAGGQVHPFVPAAYATAGLLHEAAGRGDDALRLYRRLYVDAVAAGAEITAIPSWLELRMRRLAAVEGVDLGEILGPPDSTGEGSAAPPYTLVVYFEDGLVPPREEVRLDVPILKSESGKDASFLGPVVGERVVCMRDGRCRYEPVEVAYWLSIAFPVYGQERIAPRSGWVECAGGRWAVDPVADVEGAAREQLARDTPSILARTAIRALLKYTTERQAEKTGGEIAGLIANIFGAATEQAETRTWLTLPRHISMAVIDLDAPVDACRLSWDDNGSVQEEELPVRRIGGTSFGMAGYRYWH